MSIINRQQLANNIENLKAAERVEKAMFIHQLQTIQQSVDPVFLLKRKLGNGTAHIPQLFDNLIDQSFYSATDLMKNKIGLNNGSFVAKAADKLVQGNINRFFANNRYKVKSIALAIAKNIFNLPIKQLS
ncbi:hypothetical protein QWZ08_02235 [Ferruginibacter paludis]|uniref:hypothetical protein n=1 Tax=Ferruginibacter paludis TaxID=1310417 RepID=UPI0025B567C8|nr:hypothetical protein [Ferruginibacter paludis]MDN3654425.1 hypothetical protein [Ferruginibacter paludis]